MKNSKRLNISTFFTNHLESCKKYDILIYKNCNFLSECFTLKHHLGKLSDVSFALFQDALESYNTTEYSNDIYVHAKNGYLYLSYADEHIPVLKRYIAKQETNTFIIYRYLIVDELGRLINSIVISRYDKVIIETEITDDDMCTEETICEEVQSLIARPFGNYITDSFNVVNGTFVMLTKLPSTVTPILVFRGGLRRDITEYHFDENNPKKLIFEIPFGSSEGGSNTVEQVTVDYYYL